MDWLYVTYWYLIDCIFQWSSTTKRIGSAKLNSRLYELAKSLNHQSRQIKENTANQKGKQNKIEVCAHWLPNERGREGEMLCNTLQRVPSRTNTIAFQSICKELKFHLLRFNLLYFCSMARWIKRKEQIFSFTPYPSLKTSFLSSLSFWIFFFSKAHVLYLPKKEKKMYDWYRFCFRWS